VAEPSPCHDEFELLVPKIGFERSCYRVQGDRRKQIAQTDGASARGLLVTAGPVYDAK
jgi:hypothetical protein